MVQEWQETSPARGEQAGEQKEPARTWEDTSPEQEDRYWRGTEDVVLEQDTYWRELSCERKVWFPHELGGQGARPRFTEERESTFLDEGPDDEQEVPPLEPTPKSPWASDFIRASRSPHHRRSWRWSAGLLSHQLGCHQRKRTS